MQYRVIDLMGAAHLEIPHTATADTSRFGKRLFFLSVSAQVRRAQLFFSKIADYLLNALIFSTNSGASICPNAS